MKKLLIYISIMAMAGTSNSQNYWLPEFVNDLNGNHTDLMVAEQYLDKALTEAQANLPKLENRIYTIAREYYRLGKLKKGDACQDYIVDQKSISFERNRLKGLASSQPLNELLKEFNSASFWGKTIIAERFVKENQIEQGLKLMTPYENNEAQTSRVKEVLCNYIPDIKDIAQFYKKIKGEKHRTLYFELQKRIRKGQISLYEAKEILKELNLFNDRSKELLSYAIGEVGSVEETISLINEIENQRTKHKALIGQADRSFSDSSSLKDMICSLNDTEADYECWKIDFENRSDKSITKEVIDKLNQYSNFLAPNSMVFYLINQNEIEKAHKVTELTQTHNRFTQYEYICKAYIENNRSEVAIEIINSLQSENELDEEIVSKSIEAALGIDDFELANNLFNNHLITDDYKDSCLSHYVKYYVDKKDFENVDKTISKMKYDFVRVGYYLGVGEYLIGKKWKHHE